MHITKENTKLFIIVVVSILLTVKISKATDNLNDKHETSKRLRSIHKNLNKYSKNDDYYSIIPLRLYEHDDIQLIVMHNLIFDAIKFDDEMCDFTFQNCLLDVDNEEHLNKELKVSVQCFPLQKSKYCLHNQNFVNSDCHFRSIHDKVNSYLVQLNKNLEVCTARYPTTAQQLNNSNFRFQINYFYFLNGILFNFLIILYY